MLRKGKGNAIKAPIARRKVSQKKRENVRASVARRKVSLQDGG